MKQNEKKIKDQNLLKKNNNNLKSNITINI